MTSAQIASHLYMIQLGDKEKLGSLRHLVSIIGEDPYDTAKTAAKEVVLSMLNKYYCAPYRFEQIWKNLNAAERKIVSLHVWSNNNDLSNYADDVAREFGITKKPDIQYYYYDQNGLNRFKALYADRKSKLWLLYPGYNDISPFEILLREAVGEMKREYTKVPNKLVFTSRETATSDLQNIVRFFNTNKSSVTKAGILSKTTGTKLIKFCGYEEIASDINATPEQMRTAQGWLVTYPLTVLCTIGGLLAFTEYGCVPGGKASELLIQPHEQLILCIYDAYMKSKSFNEITMLPSIVAKRGYHAADARQNFVAELKLCQTGKAIYTAEFERYLLMTKKTFARKDLNQVMTSGSAYYSVSASWEQFEHQLIYIILTFFGALGMVDISWGPNKDIYSDRGRRIPLAFKLNPLGAYVLGLTTHYKAPAQKKDTVRGGFTVLPDYTIIVPASASRIKHELYFERLFTKVSATEEAAIYKLDFDTIVRALDTSISVNDLRNYLSSSEKPLPENIARALNDWEKQSSRIRLRQVTILECEDAALLEEVIRYKGMSVYISDKISSAVIVDPSATKEIKKTIEKNQRFCKSIL